MQSGTAMHGQAASALSEMRSKYILNPSKLSGLGRGRRRASGTPAKFVGYPARLAGARRPPSRSVRGASGTPAKFVGYPARLAGARRPPSRSVRGPKQALDWLRAVCADPNRHSIGFAQCARTQTGTRLGRQGRQLGLPGTKQIPPHSCTSQTLPASAEACAKQNGRTTSPYDRFRN